VPSLPWHSCYAPWPDSRTGADLIPWLLRGAVLAGGEADYSSMHTALLYVGQVVAAVGELLAGWLAGCWHSAGLHSIVVCLHVQVLL